jgi:hypothetical protein
MATKKLPVDPPPAAPVTTPATQPDVVALETAAYQAGYDRARAECLRYLMQANDNPAVSFADALHWAGADEAGVFWLSLAARDQLTPTHITNRLRDICRTNRRLSLSATSPYRVTRH